MTAELEVFLRKRASETLNLHEFTIQMLLRYEEDIAAQGEILNYFRTNREFWWPVDWADPASF